MNFLKNLKSNSSPSLKTKNLFKFEKFKATTKLKTILNNFFLKTKNYKLKTVLLTSVFLITLLISPILINITKVEALTSEEQQLASLSTQIESITEIINNLQNSISNLFTSNNTNQLALVTPVTGGETVTVVREDCTGYEADTCFTSLSAWETAYGGIDFTGCTDGDLTCVNTSAVAQIEGSWTNPDITAVTVSGWTTSSTNYIKIYTTGDARHSGTWDPTKYRLEANGGHALRLNGYVRVDGLQIYENDAVSGRNGIYINYVDVSEYHISNNIFYAMSGNGSYGIYNADADVTNLYIWNNIVYGGWYTGIYSSGGANAFVYNNTVDTCDNAGINSGSGPMYARNNIVVDTVSGNDYHLVDGTPYSTNNISNNETAPGDNPISGKPAFVDEVGNNFHISASDTVALDAGTDLSADANLAFSTDIDGDTRSTWDIGADEVVVGPANNITISTLTTSNETTTTFDTSISFSGDDNSNATVTLYYCNETDSTGCDPTTGTSQAMTRGSGTYTYSTTGLSSPNDAGDILNIRVIATDIDGVSGSPLNTTVQLGTAPDTTAPATVSDLAISSCTATACTLTWTAPGDDNTTGTASIYNVRYSTSPITTNLDYINATTVTGEPTPSVAGTTETFTLTGLTTGTTYYFVLKTLDEASNTSDMSNVPTDTTPAPDTTAPTVPTNLSATAISSSQINLAWTASTDAVGVTGYNIYRCTGTGCTPTYLDTSTTNSYSDTGLTAETTYVYMINAYDTVPNTSANTSSVEAITQVEVVSGATRLLYENFDDQVIDSRLTPRVYGRWGEEDGVNEGDEYFLNQVGLGGTGYSFTSTTQIPDNEAYLEWTSYGGRSGPPNPWPTNEWYVSFWVRYPTYTSTVTHENIKLFYPHWDGTGSSVGYDSTGHGTLYHAERSNDTYLTNSNWVLSPNLEDGNWHHVEFYLNAETGVHRFWYDDSLNWESNHGSGAWNTPIAMYYFTFGSIDAQGDSIFSRQFDDIEVWDGLPSSTDYQCNDGVDNDSDGLTDYPNDPGCTSSTDNTEIDPPTDTTPPTLSSPLPTGAQASGTTSVTLSVTTNETATCRYSTTADTAYVSMTDTLTASGNTHTDTVTGLTDGSTYNYYVRCEDTAGNANTTDTNINFSIATAVVDTTAPTNPTISINNGNTYTDNETVTLTLSATDDVAVTEMQFSNDGTTYSTWETYSTSATHSLSTGDGTKTVYVKYRDAAQNESTPVSDTITLDTNYPTISAINSNTTSTTVNEVTTAQAVITWTTDQPSTSQVEYGFTTSYGTLSTENTTLTTSHTVNLENLSADGTTYNYRIITKDVANNETLSTNQTFTTPGTAGADVTSPASVTDLSSSNISQTSVDLNWTAPGDDDNTGTASIYDVRYSTTELTTNNWGEAELVDGEPTPSIAGTTETVYVAVGLQPNTTYYFALKTADETGNLSTISNVISFTTLEEDVTPPVVETPPSGGGGGGGGGIFVDTTAPAQPTKVKTVSADKQITLTWINPTDTDFVRTVIFRTTIEESNLSNETPDNLREDKRFTLVFEGEKEEFTDTELDNNTTYYYYISTYDKKPNFSQFFIQEAHPEAGKESINVEVEVPEIEETEGSTPNLINGLTYTEYFKTDLNYGEENEQIKKLQEILAQDEDIYPEGITSGYYGNLTVKAIQAFQRKHNIVSSGTPSTTGYGSFGPKTRAKFIEVYGGRFSTEVTETTKTTETPTTGTAYKLTRFLWAGMQNEEVKKLQQAFSLDKTIYPEGITSGYYGSLTAKAVERFQCKYSIICEGTPSSTGYGIVGSKTLKKFNEVYSVTTGGYVLPETTTPLTGEELIKSLEDQIVDLLKMVESLTAELNAMLEGGE